MKFGLCLMAFALVLAWAPHFTRAETITLEVDLLIVGGTESGCAAAVQAARMGVERIVLVNDIEWLGGQFSAEALVAIDENRGPDGYDQTVPFSRSGLFKEVIDRIEAINLETLGVARPGNTRVITTCRPEDAERAFRELVQPYVESEQLRIVSNCFPVEAVMGDEPHHLTGVVFRSSVDAEFDLTVLAAITIDASDWGDVIKLSGAGYEFGPDLRSTYDEPLAPESRDGYPLTDMNPITYCMVLNETDNLAPIPTPANYDPRHYRDHLWPNDPLWLYESRRLVDHYGFAEIDHPDMLLLCFPAIDYPLDFYPQRLADALEATEIGSSTKNIVEMTREQRQLVFDDAKQYSLGFLHYLQTEVHDAMPDQTHSFRRFALTDEFGTFDQLPPKPYVRESLRLQAMYMLRQQDTTGYRGNARNYANVMFHDSIACWQFEYDFHPTRREFLVDGDTAGPWRCTFREGRTWGPPYSGLCTFPLRSLVPIEVDGLLGGQKNLGYTSIVSSSIRLHDQSMAIGAGAGAAAAVAIHNDVQPREIPWNRSLLSQVHEGLCNNDGAGVPQMLWPFRDLEPDDPSFVAANQLAVRGALSLDPRNPVFDAEAPVTDEMCFEAQLNAIITKRFRTFDHFGANTRGVLVELLWHAIHDLPDRPFHRVGPEDADGDGILDADDPLPFAAGRSYWPEMALPADKDGNPDSLDEGVEQLRLVNFTGEGSTAVEGFINDVGEVFDAVRGLGWSRDMRTNQRCRGEVAEEWRDTFLFTRSHDIWECRVDPGQYTVTVCIGDSGFEQMGQNVTIEDAMVIRTETTVAGEWLERSVEVHVTDGLLTIEIGAPGSTTNTCLNWVRICRKPVE